MIPACFRASTNIIQKQHVLRLISTSTNSTTPTSTEMPSSSSVITKNPKFPEAPDPLSCCGSGCIKCVWIQYADEVIEHFNKNNSSKSQNSIDQYNAVKEEMEKNIQDENLRAYLLMEVKAKFSKMN